MARQIASAPGGSIERHPSAAPAFSLIAGPSLQAQRAPVARGEQAQHLRRSQSSSDGGRRASAFEHVNDVWRAASQEGARRANWVREGLRRAGGAAPTRRGPGDQTRRPMFCAVTARCAPCRCARRGSRASTGAGGFGSAGTASRAEGPRLCRMCGPMHGLAASMDGPPSLGSLCLALRRMGHGEPHVWGFRSRTGASGVALGHWVSHWGIGCRIGAWDSHSVAPTPCCHLMPSPAR